MATLENWTARPRPERSVIEGAHVRLEPLDPEAHADGLYQAASGEGAGARMEFLFEEPAGGREDFRIWLEKIASSADPLFFAVVDKADGRVKGRLALMRIDAANGVIEVGNILWGPLMARTRLATEAIYVLARHVFDDLGYRRFEWKCNDRNVPSRRAARRLGFDYEGVFRQHMVVKGKNRDTTWYAMLDRDWPQRRAAFEAWLDDDNFERDGRQKKRLEDCAVTKDDG
ncbi:GNAT family N-acetyltransferase [Aliihoeflea sp. PC F10.4]